MMELQDLFKELKPDTSPLLVQPLYGWLYMSEDPEFHQQTCGMLKGHQLNL